MTVWGWIPGVNAGWLNWGRGWSPWAAQALGTPGRGASIRTASVIGLAAVQGRGGGVRVIDCVGVSQLILGPAS